jgi:DNA polymerase III subunit delta
VSGGRMNTFDERAALGKFEEQQVLRDDPGRRRDRAETPGERPGAAQQTGAVAVRLKADEVEAHLTRRGLAALYFVTGDEPLRRTDIVAAIRDAALAAGHAERVVLYADAGFDWQALRHHLDSPSLFSATCVIEPRLGEAGPGIQGSKAIVACAERPPTGDVVLITASGLDTKARQSA